MTLTSRAIAVQEQLKQWWVAFQRDPGSTVKEFITDLYYIPSCTKYPDDWCIVAVIIIAGILLLTSLTFFCFYKIIRCVRRRRAVNRPLPPVSEMLQKMKKREKEEIEKKKKARMHHMKDQKRTASFTADDLLSVYSDIGMQYNIDTSLPDMGSRIEKYWYRVTSQEYYSCHILTIGCMSKHFTGNLDVENYINQQLSKLSHPNLQAINTIKFLTKRGKTQVAIIQPYWELGSLKDLIHRTQPVQEWAQKYNKLGEGLPRHKVALLGGQILEAVVYLYARGFNPLGHIQTGNIYMASENCCKLGGYENTLLQYRSRIYKTCAVLKCLEDIDVVMFGHVIYEMVVGKELSRLIPADVDLINVESDGCLEILEYIFDRREDGRFKRGIIKIQSHKFFGGSGPDNEEMKRSKSSLPKKKTAKHFLRRTKS